jgi:hypothetical protein
MPARPTPSKRGRKSKNAADEDDNDDDDELEVIYIANLKHVYIPNVYSTRLRKDQSRLL